MQGFAQQTQKARMPAFMDQRFGMFVHFGPVTLTRYRNWLEPQ
jgi:hypothetical protein